MKAFSLPHQHLQAETEDLTDSKGHISKECCALGMQVLLLPGSGQDYIAEVHIHMATYTTVSFNFTEEGILS